MTASVLHSNLQTYSGGVLLKLRSPQIEVDKTFRDGNMVSSGYIPKPLLNALRSQTSKVLAQRSPLKNPTAMLQRSKLRF
ncbi:hypothetical protein ACTXT7_004397 [Hymenolepis weldensis]